MNSLYSRRQSPSASARKPVRAASLSARISRYSPLFLTFIAGVLLLISLINPARWKESRIATIDAFEPILSTLSWPVQAVENWVGEMTGLTNIRAENARLKTENDQLKEWYQTALLLRAENQSLKDLLNVLPEAEQTYITSRVIGDSGSSYVRTLLIQAGTIDGAEEGQAVMGRNGMIGRIIESGDRASRVLLLTDINSHIPVIIEGVNQRAMLMGNNDDRLYLAHFAPDALIKKGGRVVTSGIGGMFPAGLPIGEIISVKNGEVKVRLLSDPEGEDYVQIVERPMDPELKRSLQGLRFPASGSLDSSGSSTAPISHPESPSLITPSSAENAIEQ